MLNLWGQHIIERTNPLRRHITCGNFIEEKLSRIEYQHVNAIRRIHP